MPFNPSYLPQPNYAHHWTLISFSEATHAGSCQSSWIHLCATSRLTSHLCEKPFLSFSWRSPYSWYLTCLSRPDRSSYGFFVTRQSFLFAPKVTNLPSSVLTNPSSAFAYWPCVSSQMLHLVWSWCREVCWIKQPQPMVHHLLWHPRYCLFWGAWREKVASWLNYSACLHENHQLGD